MDSQRLVANLGDARRGAKAAAKTLGVRAEYGANRRTGSEHRMGGAAA
jgi:hypothetical protein